MLVQSALHVSKCLSAVQSMHGPSTIPSLYDLERIFRKRSLQCAFSQSITPIQAFILQVKFSMKRTFMFLFFFTSTQ